MTMVKSLIYKKAWKLIDDLDDVGIINSSLLQIKCEDNYKVTVTHNDKFIVSKLEDISKKSSPLTTSTIIYSLLNNTSICDENNIKYSDINNNIIKILLYLVKNKLLIKKENNTKNITKNETNPLFFAINNESPEIIIENLFGVSDDESKYFLQNITTSNISPPTSSIAGLSDYNFKNVIVRNLAKYTYNYFSYERINSSKINISNNFLLGTSIFSDIIKNKSINISDIFPFCNSHPIIKKKITDLFKFKLFENVLSIDFGTNQNNNIGIAYNSIEENNAGSKTKHFMFNQLYNNNKIPKKYDLTEITSYIESLNDLKLSSIIDCIQVTKDIFNNNIKILFNIITDDHLTKKLMNSDLYITNKLIALEKLLCMLYSVFNNIKNQINKFISDIIPHIKISKINDKSNIINSLYDLKRIYDFKSIFGKNIEFIETSQKDFKKIIFNKDNKNDDKTEIKYIRINDFYNKCISNKGLFFNLINIIKNMNLFHKTNIINPEYIKFSSDKIEKITTSSSSNLLTKIDLEKILNTLNTLNNNFIDFTDNSIKDKEYMYICKTHNHYGLINIFNMIVNKNKSFYFGIGIIGVPSQIEPNINNALNKYFKINNKYKNHYKKIILRFLEYFENGVPYIQYNLLFENAKTNNSTVIYTKLLRNLAENINLYYNKDISKSYKLLYYHIILNIHNQLKVLISLMRHFNKNENIIKCKKLRQKYIKRFKQIFGKEKKFKTFEKISDETEVLSKLSKNMDILDKIPTDKKCSIFGKSIMIKKESSLKKHLKRFNPSLKTSVQINIIKGIFDDIFMNIEGKKLYIPIILSNLTTHILPNQYKYLDVKGFYQYLLRDSTYSETNPSLFFKKMLLSLNSFETNILKSEIYEVDAENVYVIVCGKNAFKNKSLLWRKMNLYVFMYHYIYIKNMPTQKTKLYALKQLLIYLYDINIYNKYTTNIWAPFTGQNIKKYYKKMNSSKKTQYDNNVSSHECLSSYL